MNEFNVNKMRKYGSDHINLCVNNEYGYLLGSFSWSFSPLSYIFFACLRRYWDMKYNDPIPLSAIGIFYDFDKTNAYIRKGE